jgi:hypothetical protein
MQSFIRHAGRSLAMLPICAGRGYRYTDQVGNNSRAGSPRTTEVLLVGEPVHGNGLWHPSWRRCFQNVVSGNCEPTFSLGLPGSNRRAGAPPRRWAKMTGMSGACAPADHTRVTTGRMGSAPLPQ